MGGARADDDVDVLLVEDNPGDVRLVERAFEDRRLPGTVHALRTGEALLDWVYRRGEFADAPEPDLVLLDLNLPATDGQELLETLKSDERTKQLPVVVLTSSQSDADVAAAYEADANACLIKPVDPEEYADLVESAVEFWISTVRLPPADAGSPNRSRDEPASGERG